MDKAAQPGRIPARFFIAELRKQSKIGRHLTDRNCLYPNVDGAQKATNLQGVDKISLPIYFEYSLTRVSVDDLTDQPKPTAMSFDPW